MGEVCTSIKKGNYAQSNELLKMNKTKADEVMNHQI